MPHLFFSILIAIPFFCFAQAEREIEGKVVSLDSSRRELVLSHDMVKVEQVEEKFIVKASADFVGLDSLSNLSKGDTVRVGISEGKIAHISTTAGDAADSRAGIREGGGQEEGSFSSGKQDLDGPGENRFVSQDE